MTHLTLERADRLADACLAKGDEIGTQPLTVAVLDPGGHIQVVKRADGSGIMRFEIAYGKAWGALGMGLPSRALGERSAKNPLFFNALAAASGGRMIPVPGGVLIRDGDGVLLGAVGISGDVSDKDEMCAVAGVEAVGLTADVEVR